MVFEKRDKKGWWMMDYAMGGGRASWSRKADLVMQIKLARNKQGMGIKEVCESVAGYSRKKLAELEEIARAEHKKALAVVFEKVNKKSVLSEREWALVSSALRMSGLDPESNMAYIGEQLTEDEYEKIEKFLKWMKKNGKAVGSANYKKVFAEFVVDEHVNG